MPSVFTNGGQYGEGDVQSEADRWRLDPAYHYGYNDAIFSRRVHDLLTLVAFVKADRQHPADRVVLVGEAGAAHWAAGALAAMRPWAASTHTVAAAVVVTGGFRFEKLPDVRHADFLPGAVKYGDLPGFLALAAPTPLWLDDPDPSVAVRLAGHAKLAGCPAPAGPSATSADAPARPAWLDFVAGPQP